MVGLLNYPIAITADTLFLAAAFWTTKHAMG